MRKLAVAMISSFLGLALGAVAVPLAAWAAMASYRPEWASEWVTWALERSPLPLYAAPVRVASDVMQRDFLVATSLAAVVLCLLAFSAMRSARRALKPADESHDGKGTLELKAWPLRVGRPVEGNIWLTHGPARDPLYRVELSCKRDHGSGSSELSETPYSEELEVVPVRTPVGWSLPFRFFVPPIAPPSGARYVSGPGYSWRLAFRRSKSWISSPSVFTLNLAPAPSEELRPLEKRETPAGKQAIGDIVRGVGREPVLHEAVQLREPSVARDPLAGRDREADQGASLRAPILRAAGVQIPEEGPSSDPRRAPRLFTHVAPVGARADDTLAYDFSTDASERASRGGAEPRLRDATPGGAQARDTTTHIGYPYGAEGASYGRETAREGPGVLVKIVKWLFLVLFGGAVAVSAIALVTAVLLAYVL